MYVDSTLKNVHQVDRYFSTSNPCQFNIEIYPAIGKFDFLRRIDVDSTSKSMCGYGIFFNAESTSILRRKVSVQTWYSLTSIQRWNFPIHKDCRFINVEYTSRFPHGISWFFDIECTSIQRLYFLNIRPVDSSTLNTRQLHVEVSHGIKRDLKVPDDVPFTFLKTSDARPVRLFD